MRPGQETPDEVGQVLERAAPGIRPSMRPGQETPDEGRRRGAGVGAVTILQ